MNDIADIQKIYNENFKNFYKKKDYSITQNFSFRLLRFYAIKLAIGKRAAILDYLKSYLNETIKKVNKELSQKCNNNESKQNFVWTMWLQEECPEIIKMCISSIKDAYPDVIILNNDNIKDYIEIPENIFEKYKNGKISKPHFSDYIRCAILDKYGGYWLDSSLYLLNKIPNFISKQNFFILQTSNKTNISNFFICSKPNHIIIKTMKYFLEEYWNNENFAIDYFFWHSIFHLITTEFEKCKLEYQKIIPDVNSKSKYFIDNYNVNFDEDLWEYLKSSYFMYKLDRKDIYNMKNENSFYNYLLNQYRKNLNKDNATGEKYE